MQIMLKYQSIKCNQVLRSLIGVLLTVLSIIVQFYLKANIYRVTTVVIYTFYVNTGSEAVKMGQELVCKPLYNAATEFRARNQSLFLAQENGVHFQNGCLKQREPRFRLQKLHYQNVKNTTLNPKFVQRAILFTKTRAQFTSLCAMQSISRDNCQLRTHRCAIFLRVKSSQSFRKNEHTILPNKKLQRNRILSHRGEINIQ